MRYLIVGAGGTGGLIGGYLAKANHDVTLIARGTHLEKIKKNGLIIHSYTGSTNTVKDIKVVKADELDNKQYDAIFICVKAYSLKEIAPVVEKASDENTIIIPILNAMEAGNILRKEIPNRKISDGCIYVTGYISAPGEITQNNKIFRIVYGFNGKKKAEFPALIQLENDLTSSDIDVTYAPDIYSAIFRKLCFTSAFAAVGSFHKANAKDMRENEEYNQQFKALLNELDEIKKAAFFTNDYNLIEENLKILNHLADEFTASLQKDLAAGKPDEREQLIFDIVKIADRLGVEAPNYHKIAEFFGYKKKDVAHQEH
ncbi:ketopantoate reductase family protein [Fulvivirga sediminis]|uniref:2-dehydropantoate 2-reductase n=1 Tax=Fulvivirga sediminis TaxID=2803949 RepID=A0A937F9G0_9BACT|nr:2-dehydropantoate 2-reductase [Fulvivirga sediminis]MBL3658145.1 2-dehydropantoate 2-reductase [Fulvivirga sediminis]